MISTYIQNYDGKSSLVGVPVINSLLRTRISAGTIKRVDFYSGNDLSVSQSVTFNLRINGVAQWSGVSRPTILGGTGSVVKTGLSIAIVRGDKLAIDIEDNNGGSNLLPVTVLFEIDDGVPILDTEAVQDIVGAMVVSGDNTTVTYNDAGNILTIEASGGGGTSLPTQTGNAGKFLTTDGTTPSWSTVSTVGNGYTKFDPDAPYSSPSAVDDEFTAATLDAKWTAVNSPGTKTENIVPSWLEVIGGTNIRGYQQTITASTCEYVLKMGNTKGYATGNNLLGGLFFRYNAAGSGWYYSFEMTATGNSYMYPVVWIWFGLNSSSGAELSNSNSRIEIGSHYYLKVGFNTSTNLISFSFSMDGFNWNLIYTTTNSAAVTNLNLIGIKAAGVTTDKAWFDFFRKVQGGYIGKLINA